MKLPENPSGLVIDVAEAAFVQPFREKYLHRPGVGMRPHVTIISNFRAVEAFDDELRADARAPFASCRSFAFALGTPREEPFPRE